MTPVATPLRRPAAAPSFRRAAMRLAVLLLACLVGMPTSSGAATGARPQRAAMAAAADAPLACPQRPSTATGRSYQGRTLSFLNFAKADLRNADFRGAVLQGVMFIGADLTGADFTGATFIDTGKPALATDFSFANLDSTCFILAKFQATTYFTYATLTCTDFSQSTLGDEGAGAVFGDEALRADPGRPCRTAFRSTAMNCEILAQWGRLDLTNADVSRCAAPGLTLLVGLDLSNARMDGVDFFEANLQGVKFDHAHLHGANLNYTNLKGASLVGAQLGVAPAADGSATGQGSLTGAYLVDAVLTDADLRAVDLTGAHIYSSSGDGVSFARARLDSAVFVGAVLPGAIFSGSLTNAAFNNAMLVNARFGSSNPAGAKFDSAYLQGADFSQVQSIASVNLSNAAVSQARGAWSYTEQDGTTATYGYGATVLGPLGTQTGASCPSGAPSGCAGTKLVPSNGGPYPPVPACKPSRTTFCPRPKPPATATGAALRPDLPRTP